MKNILNWLLITISIIIVSVFFFINGYLYGKQKNRYYTDFELFEAKNMKRIQEADYKLMRMIDEDNNDGTDKSSYFFLGDTLIKAGKVEYTTAMKCSEGEYRNKFAIVKLEKDMFYTLIRLTYNEKGSVVIGEK